VLDLDIMPMFLQVLGNQSTVTMVWLLFAAQAPSWTSRETFFSTCRNRIRSRNFRSYHSQSALLLFVGVENIFGWGKVGNMHVVDIANDFDEEAKIALLGKACQLRSVVQADIN
jgi:hypothetical protein